MPKTILCNLSDANAVIDEARQEWAYEILSNLGVSEEILNLKDVREYRYKMEELGIEVEMYSNGNVDIYKKEWHNGNTEESSGWLPIQKKHLVAQWKSPTYAKKKDDGGLYYEIRLNNWNIPWSNIKI